MPSQRDLKHMESKVLARLHEFFSSYQSRVESDGPWVEEQIQRITDEMASRPAMSDQPPKRQ